MGQLTSVWASRARANLWVAQGALLPFLLGFLAVLFVGPNAEERALGRAATDARGTFALTDQLQLEIPNVALAKGVCLRGTVPADTDSKPSDMSGQYLLSMDHRALGNDVIQAAPTATRRANTIAADPSQTGPPAPTSLQSR